MYTKIVNWVVPFDVCLVSQQTGIQSIEKLFVELSAPQWKKLIFEYLRIRQLGLTNNGVRHNKTLKERSACFARQIRPSLTCRYKTICCDRQKHKRVTEAPSCHAETVSGCTHRGAAWYKRLYSAHPCSHFMSFMSWALSPHRHRMMMMMMILLLLLLLTYSMVQSPSWEANWFAASQEILLYNNKYWLQFITLVLK